MNNTTQREEELLRYQTQMTANNLRQLLANQHHAHEHSVLAVAEQEELVQQVAQILPAGNVVNFVFNGILLAKDREIASAAGRTHLNSLLKGLSVMRDNALYPLMFGGPASLLAGYNMLLRLAGAKPEDFLPDGAWQFYVEFGLREDAARHSSETTGFQWKIVQNPANEAEQLTAWVLAVMWLLGRYPHLLAQMWEEHVRLSVIELSTGLTNLHRIWQDIRPFWTPGNLLETDFITYRRERFNSFCRDHLAQVGAEQRQTFEQTWQTEAPIRQQRLKAYLRQMGLHYTLEHEEYSDRRIAIAAQDLQVAVYYQGNYHLVALVDRDHPASPAYIFQQVARILTSAGKRTSQPIASEHTEHTPIDDLLAGAPRAQQNELRSLLAPEQKDALKHLSHAPVLINWDLAPRQQPLTRISQRKHGTGDHALTIFRTESSMVFTVSHIFFDGPWAMAVAEILTNQAVRSLNSRELMQLPLISPAPVPRTITLGTNAALSRALQKLPTQISWHSAETTLEVSTLNELRKLILNRTRPRIRLTVNDLLVLYRTIYNQRYQPSADLRAALTQVSARGRQEEQLVRNVLTLYKALPAANPALLIPINAERTDPKERIFPSTFRSPFPDFWQQHLRLLDQLQKPYGERTLAEKQKFNKERAYYLSVLNTFGTMTRRTREIAVNGQSMGNMAIRLIAGLPDAFQRLADGLPGRVGFINEAIKGEEVFSNVGQVVPGSSLTRFASARDDNSKKVLVWGIMTDNSGRLQISLRDFRAPVLALITAGYSELAQAVTQDFVDGYARGLEQFAREVAAILRVSSSPV